MSNQIIKRLHKQENNIQIEPLPINFPKIDVDLFALVTRPVVDTIAQEMILQKKLSIEECTDRCVNFLLKGFLGSK